MFCPNCGKDGGRFKFCPHCGTKIPEAEDKSSVWSEGQPCPHCGGTTLDGKNCAFCGAQLIVDVASEAEEEKDSFEIPYGSYGRRPTWLMLVDDYLIVTLASGFKNRKITIPYHRITDIYYEHPGENRGEMVISWESAEDVILPVGMKSDPGTARVVVKDEDYDVYYHLCCVLKQLIPESALLRIKQPPSKAVDDQTMDGMLKIIDFESYFEEFAPYRMQAVEAIQERMGLSPHRVIPLICQAFDLKQKELYEQEPSIAVRDLNRVLKEKKRREEIREARYAEMEAQRRARRR